MNISFDYNPETKSVTNVKVTDLSVSTKVSTAKAKVNNTIVINGGSLKLTQDALDQLKVGVGDRLCIRFNNGPVIATPQALGEIDGGNLVTKSLTVACKGKTGETLAQYGKEFNYKLTSEGYLVLTDTAMQADVAILDSSKKEDTVEERVEIEEVIRDEEFTLDIKGGQEIEFDFTV